MAKKLDTAHGPDRNALERKMNERMNPRDYWGNEFEPPWARVEALTADQMGQILLMVAGGKSIKQAAREHGSTVWAVQRQRVADEGFGQAMNEALDLRQVLLEEKAWELAHNGEIEIITKGKGDDAYTSERTTYPTWSLGQFLLKAFVPDKYGIDRQEIKAGPLDKGPETIKNEDDRGKLMDKLRERVADRLKPPIETEASEVDDEQQEGNLNDLL